MNQHTPLSTAQVKCRTLLIRVAYPLFFLCLVGWIIYSADTTEASEDMIALTVVLAASVFTVGVIVGKAIAKPLHRLGDGDLADLYKYVSDHDDLSNELSSWIKAGYTLRHRDATYLEYKEQQKRLAELSDERREKLQRADEDARIRLKSGN